MRKMAGTLASLSLIAILSGCGAGSEPAAPPPPAPSPSDDYPAFLKWSELSETQRDTVCEGVLKRGGPDRSETTQALTESGLETGEAKDMYPYVVNQCISRGL
jgi:hypothetical protein